MLLLIVGVVLAGGAGAFTGLLIAYNTSGGPKYTAEMLGHSLPTLNTLGVFCSGVALGLIFCVGVWLLVAGARHTRHRLRRQGWSGARRGTATSALGIRNDCDRPSGDATPGRRHGAPYENRSMRQPMT